jgi:RNase adapter protein RapZ
MSVQPAPAPAEGRNAGDTAKAEAPAEEGATENGVTGERRDMDLVIVTGLSGGGRSTVARALENVGYYVVDGLPQALVLQMAELAFASGGKARRTALILDVRSRAFAGTDAATGGTAFPAVADLRRRGFTPRVLFMDASDDVLVRRYESVRRTHPLQAQGRLADGIATERAQLRDARAEADLVIDTSQLNVNQLRARIEELFAAAPLALRVTAVSFGFKYGLPVDADFVVDLRWIANPHWVPELRPQTGRDTAVAEYVLSRPVARSFLDRYADLLRDVAEGFEREGKRYLTVAIGCTGGKHRSVAGAEALVARLRERDMVAEAEHRDLGRE